jgi:hypothetical protein
MLQIPVKKGEEKIEIPIGIYVNGYIIKVPSMDDAQSMLELNKRGLTHTDRHPEGD